MSETSKLTELQKKLSESEEQKRKQKEELVQNELAKLGENLKKHAQSAESTILADMEGRKNEIINCLIISKGNIKEKIKEAKADIEEELKSTIDIERKIYRLKKWTWVLISTILLLLLILISSYTFMGHKIESQLQQIDQQQKTLSQLRTWGINLNQNQNGRFLILPEGWEIENETYQAGNRIAIRIIKE